MVKRGAEIRIGVMSETRSLCDVSCLSREEAMTRSLSLRDLMEHIERELAPFSKSSREHWTYDSPATSAYACLRDTLDARRAQEPPPEEDGKLTRCLFCHAALGECKHTRAQWTVTKEPPQAQEIYGDMLCDCGHLSSRHACDYNDSDFSCFDCGCEYYHRKKVGDTPVSTERST